MKKIASLLSIIILAQLVIVPAAQSSYYTYYSITRTDGETFHPGDSLEIRSEYCWPSTKPDVNYPTRIEAKIGGSWKNVGTATYARDKSVCSKSKFPFVKIFTWKLTQVGTYQIRNRETNPILLATINVVQKSIASPTPTTGISNSGLNRSSCTFNGKQLYGSVYITDREIFSDVSVYVTDREIFSDLVVYKTSRDIFATKCGVWFVTDRENLSDFTIYFSDREIFSDLTIYLTDRELFAGIRS